MSSIQASELLHTFYILKDQIAAFSHMLKALDSGWDGWTQGINDQLWVPNTQHCLATPHQMAADIYNCLFHLHNGDGRDSWQMAGLLCVPETFIPIAQNINQTKELFFKQVKQYKQQINKTNISITNLLLTSEKTTNKTTLRQLLAHIGASRLHMKHCTRKIIILEQYPRAISLSWMKQRKSIKKLSPKACEMLLRKYEKNNDEPGINAQIQLLHQLSIDEGTRLRQVQTLSHPSIKAKVYWQDGTDSDLGYLSMPAIIACSAHQKKLPDYTRLGASPSTTQRRKRSDARLPQEPLLPSIRVFLTAKKTTA